MKRSFAATLLVLVAACHSGKHTPAAAYGEPCRQDGDCQHGLTCSRPSGATEGVCIDLCDPAASSGCVSGSDVCAAIDSTTGVCAAPSTAGQLCIEDVQCPTGAPECHWFRQDPLGALDLPVGACAQSCSGSQIGMGQGDCPAGLVCLESPYRPEPQTTDAGWVSCAGDTDCDGTRGFTCMALVDGSFCARPAGVCGHALPMYGTAPGGLGAIPVADHCGAPASDTATDFRSFCGVTDPTATVRPICLSLSASDPYEGVCVATCTSAADCGVGYTCAAPAATDPGALLFDMQTDGAGNPVTCTPGSTTCAAGFTCEALRFDTGNAEVCAKPSAVCTKV